MSMRLLLTFLLCFAVTACDPTGTDDDDSAADDDDTPDDDDASPDDDDSADDDDDSATDDDDDSTSDDDDSTSDDDDSTSDDDDSTTDDDDSTSDDDDTAADDDDTAPVNEAPTASITSPGDSSTHRVGEPLTFDAAVDDDTDAPETLSIEWSSDVDGVFSTDSSDSSGVATATTDGLSTGAHSITLEVTDSDVASVSTTLAITLDAPPSAPVLDITPALPMPGETLVASVTTDSVDPEGDTVTYTWQWSLDGVPDTGETSDVRNGAWWQYAGEVWQVTATPHDSFGPGTPGTASVTLQNTPPTTAPTVALVLESPLEAEDVVCQITLDATDVDSQQTLTYNFGWQRNGVDWTGATATTTWPNDTIPAAETSPGEAWRCFGWANDGMADGPESEWVRTVGQVRGPGLFTSLTGGSYSPSWDVSQTTCGLDAAGEIHCWGHDESGTYIDPWHHRLPDTAGWTDVAASFGRVCGIDGAGAVECWSNGSPITYQVGVPFPALVVDELAVGADGVCALNYATDALTCVGPDYTAPMTHAPTSGTWQAVSVGDDLSCAVSVAGELTCWTAVGSYTPLLGSDWADVEAGFGVCALDTSGFVSCVNPTGTVPPPTTGGWVSIHGGPDTTEACALDAAGAVTCWGGGTTYFVDRPARDGYVDVVPMGEATCALHTTGNIDCWGEVADWAETAPLASDSYTAMGQTVEVTCVGESVGGVRCLGDYADLVVGTPQVGIFEEISRGGWCGVLSGGAVECWNNSNLEANSPAGTGYHHIRVWGSSGACALDATGAVVCWPGDDPDPHGLISGAPTGNGYMELAGGYDSACVTDVAGSLTCWGNDGGGTFPSLPSSAGWGELDPGSTGFSMLDGAGELVLSLPIGGNVTDINPAPWGGPVSADGNSACGASDTGYLQCVTGVHDDGSGPETWYPSFGFNFDRATPLVSEVSVLDSQGCALDDTGHLGCWGLYTFNMHW